MGIMNIVEVQNIIVKGFDALWRDKKLEHVNNTIDKKELSEWARLSITHGQSRAITFAMAAKRGGFVSVQIFTKTDIGQGRAITLAEKAGKYLQTLSTGSLVMKPHDVVVLNNKASDALTTTETEWFQVNCIVDFVFID